MQRIVQQASDLVVYLLVPSLSMLLPARASRALVARVSRWRWLMAGQFRDAFERAARYTDIDDRGHWAQRWRQVELLDARDLFYLTFGRSASVFNEVAGAGELERARGKVLVGMHWGPSISILRLLAARGMEPTLIYRKVEGAVFRRRPFRYLFLLFAVREIRRACAGRAIPVRGAMEKLRRRLRERGTDIVVLDAPPLQGRSVIEGSVLGRRALFNAGFPQLLAESGKPYVFFSVSLDDQGLLTKVLRLSDPALVADAESFLAAYCRFLGDSLARDSSHWRIWQVAEQFFPPNMQEETREAAGPRDAESGDRDRSVAPDVSSVG